jgi:aspartate kinase
MNIVVQKFGGTSVADLECMKKVLVNVRRELSKGNKLVVVLSAQSGVTNKLLALARQYSPDPDLAELDSLVSTGEQQSTALFSMMCKDQGIKARSVLGFQAPIVTNANYTRARIESIDDQKMRAMLADHDVLLVAGFQGVDEEGRITTLGRGGSDTSAVAIAAALKAEVCEITTDPNLCSKAVKLDKISYDEMLELASQGAKVLQIRSVEFAKKYNVAVHVRSTFSEEPGTMVTQEDYSMENILVSGIAYDKDQARVTLNDVEDRPGISAAIFSPIAEQGILVDMIVQNPSREGVTDITFTIPRADLKRTVQILEQNKAIMGWKEIMHDINVAKVSIIGVGMRNHSGVAAKAFQALSAVSINIMMISTSEIKITVLLEEKFVELAVHTLHDAFHLDKR